jgi:hypothetical protein
MHSPGLEKTDQNPDLKSMDLTYSTFFFVTYEWAQKAIVLYYTKLEKLASDKHSSLLGQFICFKENDAL